MKREKYKNTVKVLECSYWFDKERRWITGARRLT